MNKEEKNLMKSIKIFKLPIIAKICEICDKLRKKYHHQLIHDFKMQSPLTFYH